MSYDNNAASADAPDEALSWLDGELGKNGLKPAEARALLDKCNALLEKRFLAGEHVEQLVRLRAQLIDRVLASLWHHVAAKLEATVALVAVGGYGRGELHPWSDVDIMLLLPDVLPENGESVLSQFVTVLELAQTT